MFLPVVLLHSIFSGLFACPAGYETLGNGDCYKTVTTPSLQREAESFCEEAEGTLVQPLNAFVDAKIRSDANSVNMDLWLGITCLGNTTTSCTYSNGNSVTTTSYTNFYPGHPNSEIGNCVFLSVSGSQNGKWLSGKCYEQSLGFGCQLSAESISPGYVTKCGSSYQEFEYFCYKILVSSMEYEAEAACELECGHLTSIHSQQENYFIQTFSSSTGGRAVRIGLEYTSSREYVWIDGSISPLEDYSNFGDTNSNFGSCVSMSLANDAVSKGKWMRTQCTNRLPAVCKRLKNGPCMYFDQPPVAPSTTSIPIATTTEPCSPAFNFTGNETPTTPVAPCNMSCCPQFGVWSEWSQTPEQCSDYCGACGNMTRTRTCLSEPYGCSCTGHATETFQCNIGVCDPPRLACCPGYTQDVINGREACGPLANYTANEYINTCGVTCCPPKGIWGEWTETVPCNDTCGSCGTLTKTRKCLSLQYGCECTGAATMTSVCPINVCLYPRKPCCPGFSEQIDPVKHNFFCGPLPVEPVFDPEPTTCCDPERKGLWNQWSEWSSCSATCGLCGVQTRNRTCASQPYGCPCVGEATESRRCGSVACPGTKCCAPNHLAVAYDGAEFCQVDPPQTCSGTWSDWMYPSGSVCNGTCGMCGERPVFRYCWPSGCQCDGPFKQVEHCGEPVCLYPKDACCPGFCEKIINKTFACVKCPTNRL